jgi:hypothetical protein
MSELEELPLDYWGRQKLFKERLAKIQGTATTIPSYREVVDKLAELEEEHELLGRRYDELTKLLRKQGKDKASERDSFLRNYAKDWK